MRIFIVTIIIFISPLFLKAQEVYDLQRCLQTGLERNYNIRIITNEQQMASNNFTIGNAGYLPTLSLDAGYSGSVNDIKQDLSAGGTIETDGVNNQTTNAGANLGWMVFDGLKIQANYSRLKELKNMGELNTRLTVEDFISQLTAEYYNYVQQNIRLKNLRSAVDLSRERLRIVEARYNIGSMSRLDLQQAKVDFNADSSKLLKQFEILYSSRIRLNELMSLDDVSRSIIVKDSIIVPNGLLEKSVLWEKTLSSNTSLLLSEKSKTLSQLDYKIIKSRNFPYLKLNAGYGYVRNDYGTGTYNYQESLGFNYGLSLGFSIFDGMNRKREQKNARLSIQNRELMYEQLELELKADLSNIWMAYRNNLKLLGLEKQNLLNAKENYEIAIERYKLGDLSGIELREAQNSLLEAEERLLLAEYNTKICEISLMQISGQATQYMESF